jgi:hypothetical protein
MLNQRAAPHVCAIEDKHCLVPGSVIDESLLDLDDEFQQLSLRIAALFTYYGGNHRTNGRRKLSVRLRANLSICAPERASRINQPIWQVKIKNIGDTDCAKGSSLLVRIHIPSLELSL